MEKANKLRERADRYRRLLWDVTDVELIKSLQALIAMHEMRAAERLREVSATDDTAWLTQSGGHM
jgi:hypothetical protein